MPPVRCQRRCSEVVLFFCLLFLAYSISYAESDFMSRIKDRSASVDTMKGTFIQRSWIEEMNRETEYRGAFYIKKPGKMFWRYEDYGQEVFVIDDLIIIHYKKQNQAFKRVFDQSTFGRLPIVVLHNLKDMEEDYEFMEKAGFLRLTPKILLTGIKYIDMYPSSENFPISRFIVVDKHNNRVEITLSDIETNLDLDDALFIFDPPEGVTVIE